jgi:preprotein translocase SecE subunit
MARQAVATQTKSNPVKKARSFFHEVYTEMQKVVWPTKEELRSSTGIVLMLLAALAVIIGVYVIVFQQVVIWLLKIL